MHEPTARPQVNRLASLSEAAPTAQQWACCAVATWAGMVGMHPMAWQAAMYQVAYRNAVESVQAARLRAERARWN